MVLSIFSLHHLTDFDLRGIPVCVRRLLRPGGVFYALEPSARRLSGAIGALLIPNLMKTFQTPDERPLVRSAIARQFEEQRFRVRLGLYDFCSTSIAGLLPGCRSIYRFARVADNSLVSIPGIPKPPHG